MLFGEAGVWNGPRRRIALATSLYKPRVCVPSNILLATEAMNPIKQDSFRKDFVATAFCSLVCVASAEAAKVR
jgi:hypothetical protein